MLDEDFTVSVYRFCMGVQSSGSSQQRQRIWGNFGLVVDTYKKISLRKLDS